MPHPVLRSGAESLATPKGTAEAVSFHETILPMKPFMRWLLECSGLGGADLVAGMGPMGWIEVRSLGKEIAAEGNDADGGDHRGPGGEEQPSAIGEKRTTKAHRGVPRLPLALSRPVARADAGGREASQAATPASTRGF